MDNKGVGNLHEILFAILFVVMIATVYAEDFNELMPMMFILIGGVLIMAGAVNKESDIMAGGILFLGFALVYAEVVL